MLDRHGEELEYGDIVVFPAGFPANDIWEGEIISFARGTYGMYAIVQTSDRERYGFYGRELAKKPNPSARQPCQ